ncbi:hypothetical protein TNCV_4562601 [Trichonephila clavipes]|uniref:Uncharacterized protein n=1 Tax=Trichonephila clavipes TaxID=2585209 RepID=A0A8X6W4W4_TRICX|nr:hypothetical protein TNCV_4562601 [Trichonephila clavipes]
MSVCRKDGIIPRCFLTKTSPKWGAVIGTIYRLRPKNIFDLLQTIQRNYDNRMVVVANWWCGRSSLVVKVSDRGWLVTSSSLVPLKTRRVGKRCPLNLSRAQTSSCWCGVAVRRGGASSGVVHVT